MNQRDEGRLRALSPREARRRFLKRREQTQSPATVRSYGNRLNDFILWAENENIESMSELTGWEIDDYHMYREAQDIAPATVRGTMVALRQLLLYCARVEVVDEELPDKVDIPTLSKEQASSSDRLETEDAKALLNFYRDSTMYFGTAWHAFLEVTWHTGARLGGVRALDLCDYDSEAQTLEFRHQPKTGTALKNKKEGERVVGIGSSVVEALDMYVARERSNKRDGYGREPLFSCSQGRPSRSTFRGWCYLGTQPCIYQPCPHSADRHTCKFTDRSHASKCPSSRSPHMIRTGSISWQLDRGLPIDLVAERVNAAPDTIRRYYDKSTELEKFRERRQRITTKLDIDNGE